MNPRKTVPAPKTRPPKTRKIPKSSSRTSIPKSLRSPENKQPLIIIPRNLFNGRVGRERKKNRITTLKKGAKSAKEIRGENNIKKIPPEGRGREREKKKRNRLSEQISSRERLLALTMDRC